jgi:hypothetical protein
MNSCAFFDRPISVNSALSVVNLFLRLFTQSLPIESLRPRHKNFSTARSKAETLKVCATLPHPLK